METAAAVELIPVGVAITDAAGKIEYANAHLCRLLGLAAEELVGFELAQFRSLATAAIRVEVKSALIAGDTWQGEIALHVRRPEPRAMLESCHPLLDHAGRVRRAVHFFHDLSVLRRNPGLTRHTFYDGVTGLPSRSLLEERLSAAIASARRSRGGLALLYTDIEHFDCINVVLDHDAGDALLRLMGARMRNLLRASDTVARFEGDEFAVILRGVGQTETARHAADKLRRACSGWYQAAGNDYSVTISVGASLYPRDGETVDGLLCHATRAMHHAKAAHRDACAAEARCVGTEYDVAGERV